MLLRSGSALLFVTLVSAQVPSSLAPFSTFLKANSITRQVATDAQGNIYIYGETNGTPTAGYPLDVFVAKLDPTAASVTWTVDLGGSTTATYAGALAVDTAGNAYITGYTTASDFPTQPAVPNTAPANTHLPFVAKINASGAIVYSTLFSNGASADPLAIAVDKSGDAIVSGGISSVGYPATPGAYTNLWTSGPPFVTKIDPTGTKIVFSALGVGGSSLALDSAGNIFIAGTTSWPPFSGSPLYPTTPGAFQTTYTPVLFCPGPICMQAFALGEQYATKLSADGSTLIYSTFVTGSLGSYNAGMAVDSSGDVWLTGDTASSDYPYTQGGSSGSLSQTFTTELDPTGSKVLLSVAEGVPPGNQNNLAFDPQGNLIEVGMFPVSPDNYTYPPNVSPAPAPPSTAGIPSACLSSDGVYVLRISSKDGSVLATQILPGGGEVGSAVDSQGNIYIVGSASLPNIPLTPGVFYDTAVTQRTVSGGFLERTSFAVPASPLACVTDSPTMTPIGPVAPGQLITLYGSGIGPAQPALGLLAGASTVPTSLGGVTVTFNGQPAPILYASSTQINVQAPFEIDRNPYTPAENTVMQLSYNGSVLATRSFAVTPQNPSLFVQEAVNDLVCGNTQGGGALVALAFNQDGSLNSCTNPAPSGSTFTVFVNGIGYEAGNEITGSVTAKPRSVSGSAALFNGEFSLEVDAFADQPNAISGIGQLTARVPYTVLAPGPMYIGLTINNLLAGPLSPGGATSLVVFVKP